MGDVYQRDFTHREAARTAMYDVGGRTLKANKILAILKDCLGRLNGLSLLDLGASTGIITALVAREFRHSVGIDIDLSAVRYAARTHGGNNICFVVGHGIRPAFAADSFDVVICNQVYEHVPDARAMMSEIRRVLRPGGVCYFGANNRLKLIETHYGRLPLLSVFPKPLAHLYLRILRRASYYYETHFTVWGLRRLVADFEIIDYTARIVADPVEFCATDMITSGTLHQKLALQVLKYAFWLFPGYIWLLKKPASG